MKNTDSAYTIIFDGITGFNFPDWAATTAYVLKDHVVPTTPNGYVYECTTAGTSGGTEPTWGTTIGGTTTDGTAVWTCRGQGLLYAIKDDKRLDAFTRGKLNEALAFAYANGYTEHWMDNVVFGALKQLFRYVRN